ncbi:MAG: GerMN domain-containing protein [Actinomycetota bacterium]
MQRRAIVLTTALVLVTPVVAVACGVVGNGSVERINPPAVLSQTIPTTTTTTPATTQAATSTSGLQSTTTQVQTEQVRLYFIASGQLNAVSAPLATPASLAQIMAALQGGPPEGSAGFGLRTALPRVTTPDDDIKVTNNNKGVAVVELPKHFFDTIAVTDQRLVTAQIVLTLTDSRGIGQVEFNQTVPRASGESVPVGSPLSRADFVSLTDSATGTTTTNSATGTSIGTSTTSTSTTSTKPPKP